MKPATYLRLAELALRYVPYLLRGARRPVDASDIEARRKRLLDAMERLKKQGIR